MAKDKRAWQEAKREREKRRLKQLGSRIYRAVERTGLDKAIELSDIKMLYRATGDSPDKLFSRRVAIAATILANEKLRDYYSYERISFGELRRLFDSENNRDVADWMCSVERRDYVTDVITGTLMFSNDQEGASK